MANGVQTFEVKVETKKNGSRHYSYHVGMYIENKVVKMFHIDAKNGKKAMRKAQKYGRPLSARKIEIDGMTAGIERLVLDKAVNPYPDAVAMDEMVWRRKDKREERIRNRKMNKNGY